MTATSPSATWSGHPRGSAGYRRVVAALVTGGIATFAQLYAVQPLMPQLAAEYTVSPDRAALALSLATAGLSALLVPWSGAADWIGRARVMTAALAASTLLGLAVPFAGELWQLLALRAVQGMALGGLPAVAVAYLAEELRPADFPRAAGLYIAGTTVGGMLGRLVAGTAADLGGWRWGVAADGLLGLVALVLFAVLLPRPRGFVPRRRGGGGPGLGRRLAASLADRGLLALYAQGLFLMGGFVTVYNYLSFELLGPPFGLSQTAVSFLFAAYLAGTAGSALAARLNGWTGRHRALLLAALGVAAGAALLLLPWLAGIVAGLVLLTFAFFTAHATASGWVGHRARWRAQAAALYTLGYYLGSSLFGWIGGIVYQHAGWPGTVGYVLALVAAAAVASLALRGRPAAAQQRV
ncbi:MFS transporter [Allonocardiopsis opalescens]|uniref:MFS transporter n=1 Tax=Allonocardiopsis opalescens TaxID=1144618 RepID=UPI000D079178|nr:MFS transporter [Allonocardiopsis opalescens]